MNFTFSNVKETSLFVNYYRAVLLPLNETIEDLLCTMYFVLLCILVGDEIVSEYSD